MTDISAMGPKELTDKFFVSLEVMCIDVF